MQNPTDVVVENNQLEPPIIDTSTSDDRRSIWRNRDFLILWAGQVTSVLGSQMAGLAYPLLVLALTHSTAKAGLVPVFWVAPFVLFGLPAGALVDRWNRKTVMLICDTIRMFGVFSLPVAYFTGFLTVPLVYAAALAEGVGFCFFNIAEVSALPRVVSKSQLPHAMAMNEAGYAAMGTVGPGVAGALIGLMKTQVAGTVVVFIVDGVSYMASLLGLASIKTSFQQPRRDQQSTSIWTEVREGLEFIWENQRIRTVAFWAAWTELIYGPMQLAIIVMVHQLFHRGAGAIGLVFTAGGIGGIIGATLAPRLKKRVAFGRLLMLVVGVQGIATFFEALAPNLYILAAMQLVLQMGRPIWNVTQMSYRLSVIPDALQGRVNSCYRLLIFVAFPLGAALGGLLLEHLSPRLLIASMALGVMAGLAVISTTNLRTAR